MAAEHAPALGGKDQIVALVVGKDEILARRVARSAPPAELEGLELVGDGNLDVLDALALVWNCLAPDGQEGVHHHISLPALCPGEDEIYIGEVFRVPREADARPALVAGVRGHYDELDGVIFGPELPVGLVAARGTLAAHLAAGSRHGPPEAALTILAT